MGYFPMGVPSKLRNASSQPYLTEAQTQCLHGFGAEILGARSIVRQISYHLIGSADLKDRDQAAAMLRALQFQDWVSASSHNALAGANNLLLGVLLRVEAEDGTSVDYWVAMRSPFDLLDAPSLVACGKVDRLPEVGLAPLLADTKK
jgi:hypothetical protein